MNLVSIESIMLVHLDHLMIPTSRRESWKPKKRLCQSLVPNHLSLLGNCDLFFLLKPFRPQGKSIVLFSLFFFSLSTFLSVLFEFNFFFFQIILFKKVFNYKGFFFVLLEFMNISSGVFLNFSLVQAKRIGLGNTSLFASRSS